MVLTRKGIQNNSSKIGSVLRRGRHSRSRMQQFAFLIANHLTTPKNLNSIFVLGHSSHKQSYLIKHLRNTSEQGAFDALNLKKERSMNQPIREALSTPTGWLVAPTRDFCLFFIRDPKSAMFSPTVFTQLLYLTEEGFPKKSKKTRRLDYQSAN